jgi:hypothetical protein
MLHRLCHDQPASFAFTPANLAWAQGQISISPDRWLKEHARRLPSGMPFLIGQKVGAVQGGSGNAPRFPARQETTHPQDRSNKRNEGQRPTRRGRSARRGRGGRWPGALAPGGCAARAPHGRGDGPGQSIGTAKDIHAFRSGSPFSWHFCNAVRRVINDRTNRCRMADMSKAVQRGHDAWREFNP